MAAWPGLPGHLRRIRPRHGVRAAHPAAAQAVEPDRTIDGGDNGAQRRRNDTAIAAGAEMGASRYLRFHVCNCGSIGTAADDVVALGRYAGEP